MQPTDWSNVKVPEPEPPTKPPSIIARLAFAVVAIAALAAGVVFLTVVMLGNRVRERTIAACNGPSCVLEVRGAHDDCYMSSVTIRPPASAQDFQTGPDSDVFGFASVEYAAYVGCTGVSDKLNR